MQGRRVLVRQVVQKGTTPHLRLPHRDHQLHITLARLTDSRVHRRLGGQDLGMNTMNGEKSPGRIGPINGMTALQTAGRGHHGMRSMLRIHKTLNATRAISLCPVVERNSRGPVGSLICRKLRRRTSDGITLRRRGNGPTMIETKHGPEDGMTEHLAATVRGTDSRISSGLAHQSVEPNTHCRILARFSTGSPPPPILRVETACIVYAPVSDGMAFASLA